MPLPKVKFVSIPINLEINWIYHFLFEDRWKWGKYIIRRHPELKQIFKLKDKKRRIIFLKKYILNFRKTHKNKIKNNEKRYKRAWQKNEEDYLRLFEQILNTKWPQKKIKMTALMSIDPICPRFLDDWSFSLYFDREMRDAVEIIMHECCHFLYFKKWQEIFSKAKRETFECPHLEWQLSEIVAPIILNDRRVQKYLGKQAVFYEEYWKLKINNSSLPKYFTKLYNSYIKNNKNFDEFIKEAYKIIKKNKNLF